MSYEESRGKAVDGLENVVINPHALPIGYWRQEIRDTVDAIIEAAVWKCKEEQTSHPYIRAKSMPEVRQKGWDDAVQAAVRIIEEYLEHEDMSYGKKLLERLRNNVKGLECL